MKLPVVRRSTYEVLLKEYMKLKEAHEVLFQRYHLLKTDLTRLRQTVPPWEHHE